MTGKTAEIITIACFGALGLYIISMVAFMLLRKNEPDLERPFKVPMFPYFPICAFVIASVALVAMSYHNLMLAAVYFGMMGLAWLWFKFLVADELKA